MTLNVVLISTYELGRQPFGLASPAAWLRQIGARVECLDLAISPFDQALIKEADLVAFYVPMHMGTRMAVPMIKQVRQINPNAHLCCYGLYAPMNEDYLRRLGAKTILGGEFEAGLTDLAQRLTTASTSTHPHQPLLTISLARQQFLVPDRSRLPALNRYAHLVKDQDQHVTVGYTEASRGCKHTCRHCPIVPVYNGRFRVVQVETVLADIRQQVEAGAQHISFGDPDFFNGPGHAMAIAKSLHEQFPQISYDVIIKVEHLLKQAHHLKTLK